MKVRFEVEDGLQEDEVVIRCSKIRQEHLDIQDLIEEKNKETLHLEFHNQGKQYYLSLDTILFFESLGDGVVAQTKETQYQVKLRLYELEEKLPSYFKRISKSAIVNMDKIYSINRDLTSSSSVEFLGTGKKAYVSRNYYKELKASLNKKRRK
ncbi:MAG: LytTR family DNA-binding domain-containing protein [Anaerorhabdus sp.]